METPNESIRYTDADDDALTRIDEKLSQCIEVHVASTVATVDPYDGVTAKLEGPAWWCTCGLHPIQE